MPERDQESGRLSIHSQDGIFYCKKHYVDKFAEKCHGCSFGIDGQYIVAMEKRWHSECFCCHACNDCLVPEDGGGAEFCVHNDFPYCLNDWDGLFGTGFNGIEGVDAVDEVDAEESGAMPTAAETETKTSVVTSNQKTTPPTPPTPPPRKKHQRKISAVEDIRKSALATASHCRSTPVVNALGVATGGGIGNEGSLPASASASSSSDTKNKKRKNKKKGPEWGAMIGALFSQGIGHAVREHDARAPMLTKSTTSLAKTEYKERYSYRLNQNSKDLTSSSSNKFDMEDFAPSCFRHLRNTWNINNGEYLNSMCRTPLSGGQVGEGKSGMLFFFSSDKKYIVKTVTQSELPFFIKIMKQYHEHMLSYSDSLLSRFMGLYRMKVSGNKAMTVVVMQNLFYTNLLVHEKYDLKGSTVKRFVTQREIDNGTSVLKDLNFKTKIYLSPTMKASFLETMKNDANFLRVSNIMDYSLLLGINNDGKLNGKKDVLPPPQHPTLWQKEQGGILASGVGGGSSGDSGGEKSSEKEATYFLGIIDILQKYNLKKKLENAYKSRREKRKGKDPEAISAVGSSVYARRFEKYIESLVA
jgi:hypothetical protein